MIDHLLAVAATEIRIGIRNRWVLLAVLTLLVFALVLALLGTTPGGAVKADRLTVTVASLATLSVYLVPLLALLLAFDAIAGEVERGTLPLMLATPASRSSVVLGKFIGHLAVIAFAIVIGYGLPGAAVWLLSGDGAEGTGHLLRLMLTSIALDGAFLGVGYLASACVRQTGTAAALAAEPGRGC